MSNDEVEAVNNLLWEVGNGDHSSFDRLYEIMGKPVFRFIRTFVKSSEAAEDLVQETFIRIIRKASLFRCGNCTAWIFQIAKNLSINYLKKCKRERENVIITKQDEPAVECEAAIIERLDRNRLIETLDDGDKRIMILKSYDLTAMEIARLLRLSERTIQRRLKAIRTRAQRYYGSMTDKDIEKRIREEIERSEMSPRVKRALDVKWSAKGVKGKGFIFLLWQRALPLSSFVYRCCRYTCRNKPI